MPSIVKSIYASLLECIYNDLSRTNVSDCFFLLDVSSNEIDTTNARELFKLMESHKSLGHSNVKLLKELMETIERKDIVKYIESYEIIINKLLF